MTVKTRSTRAKTIGSSHNYKTHDYTNFETNQNLTFLKFEIIIGKYSTEISSCYKTPKILISSLFLASNKIHKLESQQLMASQCLYRPLVFLFF